MKCLEHPVSGMPSDEEAGTRDDRLQDKRFVLLCLVPGGCHSSLLAVEPPIMLEALAPFWCPSLGVGHLLL